MEQQERERALSCVNTIQNILDTLTECNDLWMSDIRKLQDAYCKLSRIVGVASPKDEDGKPKHYADKVLDDDPQAWHYEK